MFFTGVTGAALVALYKTKPTSASFYSVGIVNWAKLHIADVREMDLVLARLVQFKETTDNSRHAAVGLLGTWIPLTDIPYTR
jgi:hypothetical protein